MTRENEPANAISHHSGGSRNPVNSIASGYRIKPGMTVSGLFTIPSNLIEAWGTGFQRMRKALEKYPEVDLIIQEVGYAFQLQFRKKMVDRTSTGQVPDKVKLLKY